MSKLPVFKEIYVQSGNASPLQIIPPMAAMGKPTYEIFNGKLAPLVCFFKNGLTTAYYEKANFADLATKALAVLSKSDYVYRIWKKHCAELLILSKATEHSPFDDSIDGFKQAYYKLADFWKFSVFIDSFDTGTDFREIAKIGKEHGFTPAEIQLLTTPAELSYLQDFELKLGTKNAVELVDEFFWINTDYSTWKKTTRADIEQLKKEKAHTEKALSGLNSYSKNLASKQGAILDKYGLSKNPFSLINQLITWRDERKKFNYIGLHGLGFYARKILHENGIDRELFSAVTPEEYLGDLPLPAVSDLKNRLNVGMVATAFVDHYEITFGSDAVKIYESFESKRKGGNFDLRGQSASLGKVTGRVMVIHRVEELGTFKPGCILVTSMTRPEFVPAMKKAIGIITDEGGITCHAAIVSREFEIPCIVGTQIATKQLKTGDLVELDAFHGLVKKLDGGSLK